MSRMVPHVIVEVRPLTPEEAANLPAAMKPKLRALFVAEYDSRSEASKEMKRLSKKKCFEILKAIDWEQVAFWDTRRGRELLRQYEHLSQPIEAHRGS